MSQDLDKSGQFTPKTRVDQGPTFGWVEKGVLILSQVTTAAQLPAASLSEGFLVPVSDSAVSGWGQIITGGGNNHVLAYSNGTTWTVAAGGNTDILLVAGQSNAEGAGVTYADLPPRLQSVDTGILTWNGSSFVTQQNGVNSNILSPDNVGIIGTRGLWGPDSEFAYRYRLANPQKSLFIIKFAQGATPICTTHGTPNWTTGTSGSLFDLMTGFATGGRNALNATALPSPFAHWLLWMQGEQDATFLDCANAYAANLANFITQARASWAGTSAMIVAIGEISTIFANSTTVRAAQAAANGPTTPFVPSDTWPMWSAPHYDGIGLASMGADMWRAITNTPFTPSSPQSSAFLARTSGLTTIHKEAYDALISGLVSDGVFAKLDALWVPATNDSTTAALNLVSSSLPLAPTGGASWIVNRGYFANGSAGQFIDTGVNLSTFAGHAGQTSGHVGIFSISTGQHVFAAGVGVGVPGVGSGVWAGVSTDPTAATNCTRIQPQDNSGNTTFSYNDGTSANSGVVATNGIGHFVVNRTTAALEDGYYNGALVTSPNHASGTAPNLNLSLGNENSVNNGHVFGVDTQLLAAAHIGGALTATDVANLHTRLQNYFNYIPVYTVGGLTSSRYIDRAWQGYQTSPTGGLGPALFYRNAFDVLLTALDASGVARKLDAMWIWAQTGSQNTNIISKFFNSVAHGSPTYTADQGYTGVDASSTVYVDLAWNPSSFVGDSFYVQNSAHMSVWCLNNVLAGASGGVVLGGTDGTTENRLLLRNSAGNLQAGINGTGFITAANANSIGHWLVNRSSASAVQVYHNGASFASGSDTSKVIQNQNFFALASDTSGSPAQGSACQLAMVSVGGSLNATDVANFYNALRAYMTTVGIP